MPYRKSKSNAKYNVVWCNHIYIHNPQAHPSPKVDPLEWGSFGPRLLPSTIGFKGNNQSLQSSSMWKVLLKKQAHNTLVINEEQYKNLLEQERL